MFSVFNIFVFVVCYLVAAISPSIILCKKIKNVDIRTIGSGNAGTTNSIRAMGKGWGAVVFILDLLKVVVSYGIVFLVAKLFKQEFGDVSKSLYMLASIVGHSYPVYYGFKGGKGVAVFLMSALMVDYKAALVCITVGVITIAISRMVSLGSMVGAALLVIVVLFMETNFNIWLTILLAAIIIFNHRANIKRIIDGNENKLF